MAPQVGLEISEHTTDPTHVQCRISTDLGSMEKTAMICVGRAVGRVG